MTSSTKLKSIVLAALMVMSVFAGFAGTATAATGAANASASDTTPGSPGSQHVLSITMEQGKVDDYGDTLTAIEVEYPSAFDLTNVSNNVSLTQGGDARNVTDVSRSGTTLTISTDNGTALEGTNATVEVTVGNVTNPTTQGTYGVTLTTNPGSSSSFIVPLAIGGGTQQLPQGPVQDDTATSNTTENRDVEIADVTYTGSAGNVSTVQVDVAGGTGATANASDVSDVNVRLYNGSSVLSSKKVTYSQDPTIVDFSGTAAETGDRVDRVQIIATIDSTADDGDVINATYTLQDPNGTVATQDTRSGNQTILTTNTGFIRGEVQNEDGDPLPDVEVDIYEQNSNSIIETVTTRSDGEFGNVRAAPGDYVIRINETGFETFSQSDRLNAGGTIDMPVTLVSNRVANNVTVAVWDGSAAAGDEATLPANNESSTTAMFVVYSQDQLNDPLNSSLDVTLSFANATNVGDFVDNDTLEDTLSITINASNQDDVDGDGSPESYATFEVTSDNATQSTFDAVGEPDGLRTELFNATATNSDGQSLQDTSNVTYVLEGDKGFSGIVSQYNETSSSYEDAPGVTVWAVYQAQSNKSLAFTEETFPFLVAETNADGHYSFKGIAGNATNVTIYAIKSGYNQYNRSGTSVGRFVAHDADRQTITAPPSGSTEEHNIQIEPVSVLLEYRINTTIAKDPGGTPVYEEARVASGNTHPVRVTLESKPTTAPDSEFGPASGETVTVSLSNNAVGSLANASDSGNSVTIDTDASGEADLTFTGDRDVFGQTNITGEISNDDGTRFHDNASATVFGTGSISGDVVDNATQPVATTDDRIVRVNLWWLNSSTGEYEAAGDADRASRNFVNTSEFGTDQAGHYAFTSVETGHQYKLNVSVVDRESGAVVQRPPGFATVPNKVAGTDTADIVLDISREDISLTSVEFEDQTVDNGSTTVTVASATLADGGFVVIHDAAGDIIGSSDYLSAGTTNTDIEIELDSALTSNQTLTAMAHTDDGDETFNAADDPAYTRPSGATVSTDADITVSSTGGSNGVPAHLSAADSNGDGEIGDTEVLGAIGEWRDDTGEDYTDIEILDIIEFWRTGDDISTA